MRRCAADLFCEAAPGSLRLTPLRVARRPLLAPLAGGRGATQVPACLTLRVSLRHAPLWHPSSASLPRGATLCMSKGSPLCADDSRASGQGSAAAGGGAPAEPALHGGPAIDRTAGASFHSGGLAAPAASEVRNASHAPALRHDRCWASAPVISLCRAVLLALDPRACNTGVCNPRILLTSMDLD